MRLSLRETGKKPGEMDRLVGVDGWNEKGTTRMQNNGKDIFEMEGLQDIRRTGG